jgi:hypothetical protein
MKNPDFFSSCVDWCSNSKLENLEWLCENSEEITLSDFKTRVDPESFDNIRKGLGYCDEGEEGLRIEDDLYVEYYLERQTGIAYILHSAIEYVFATPEQIELVEEIIEKLEDEEFDIGF